MFITIMVWSVELGLAYIRDYTFPACTSADNRCVCTKAHRTDICLTPTLNVDQCDSVVRCETWERRRSRRVARESSRDDRRVIY